MYRPTILWTLLPALAFSFIAVHAGEQSNIISHRRTQTISIDGDRKDWKGITFTPVDAMTSIAATNDGDSLYLCVVSIKEHHDAPFPGGGLTVWMDPEGSGSRKFAVHISLVRGAGGPSPDFHEPPDGGRREALPPPQYPLGGSGIEVRSPGERDWMTVKRAREKGIILAEGTSDEGVVFEVRLPLTCIGVAKERAMDLSKLSVGIGIERVWPMPGRGPRHARPEMDFRPEDVEGCDIDDVLDLESPPGEFEIGFPPDLPGETHLSLKLANE